MTNNPSNTLKKYQNHIVMKTENFSIRSYPKSELAQLYFPGSEAHVALNRLNSWIKRCQPLVNDLDACYQCRHAKFFSAQAVRLIVKYLGEP
jgi:hypothetical protein